MEIRSYDIVAEINEKYVNRALATAFTEATTFARTYYPNTTDDLKEVIVL